MAKLIWLGALLVCSALSSSAQGTPPPQASSGQSAPPARKPRATLIPRTHDEREDRYRAQHRIILNVVVTDAAGKPVTGMTAGDFTLLDNDRPQTIASFRAIEDAAPAHPAHVIFVLDTVNNSSRSIGNDRKQIERFLKLSSEHLANPTSILTLSESGVRMSSLSSDRDVLIGELKEISGNLHPMDCDDEANSNDVSAIIPMPGVSSTGQTAHVVNPSRALDCLNRRFERSITELNKFAKQQVNVPARVILIWIGPGWPLLSAHEFSPDSAAIRGNFFSYLVDLSTSLREAQVTLDAVSPPDLFRKTEWRSDHDNAFFDGVPTEDEVTAGSFGLQVLAHQSGGQILTEGKDLPSEIVRCIADDKSYYVLSFDSPAASTPGEFHSLRVKAIRPGLSVRTNTAYYGQP
jgi:VWFA-related protein